MEHRQIRAILRGLTRLSERVVKKVTLDVTANLVESTPVDTGWARANWVPRIGEPHIEDLSDTPSSAQGARSAQSRQQSAIGTVAAQYRLPMGKVFVSNNVPYVPGLNDGSSKQAPAGFVQRAIAKAVKSDIRGLS